MLNQRIETLLHQYYPHGLSKDTSEYWSSTECKNFESLLLNTVHTPNSSYLEWCEFLEILGNEINMPVRDFTDGQTPNFFALIGSTPSKVPLELPGLTEEIHLRKSFLTNHFTVVGLRYLKWPNSTGHISFTNLEALISPSDCTSDIYNKAFDQMKEFCKGFEFMSYSNGQTIVNNIELPFSDKSSNRLFDAIFSNFEFSGYELVGNIDYE